MTVRTRWAPSPTGYAHLGFVSRVLINYAMAKKNNGQFVWRNEDTDRERFVPGSLEFNMKWMREFGLDWDEGPDKGGPYAPYNQSERLEMYKEASEKLIENGVAYKCFCSKERLDELRKSQEAKKERTRYDGLCRNLSKEEIEKKLSEKIPYTVRIKMPRDRKIEFDDLITHNHIVWDSNEVDDYILLKSDGYPTYHLAVVVDDSAMKITHAFRGSEWIATTPVHLMVYEGLGITEKERPGIGHFTVITDPNTPGKKFSKRNSAFKVNGLVIQGYLKPAILNYLMLLGWAPKDNREIFSLAEFIEAFDLGGMQRSNPAWDQKKMDWFNGVYQRELSKEQYTTEFKNWIESYLLKESREDILSALVKEDMTEDGIDALIEFAKMLISGDEKLLAEQLSLVQERSVNFWQALSQLEFFYEPPKNIDWNIKQLKNVTEARNLLVNELYQMTQLLNDDSKEWKHEEWEEGVRNIAEKNSQKHGDIFMLLRVLIVGSPFSPPLFESMQLLGKEECIKRIKAYIS